VAGTCFRFSAVAIQMYFVYSNENFKKHPFNISNQDHNQLENIFFPFFEKKSKQSLIIIMILYRKKKKEFHNQYNQPNI